MCWTSKSTKGNCRLIQREQHRAAQPSAFLPPRKPQCCVSCVLSKRCGLSGRVIWGFEVWSTVATVTHVCRQHMWCESEFNQGGNGIDIRAFNALETLPFTRRSFIFICYSARERETTVGILLTWTSDGWPHKEPTAVFLEDSRCAKFIFISTNNQSF